MIITFDAPTLSTRDLHTLYYMGFNPTDFYPTGQTRLEFFPDRVQSGVFAVSDGEVSLPEVADVDVNTIARIARDMKCKVTINYGDA